MAIFHHSWPFGRCGLPRVATRVRRAAICETHGRSRARVGLRHASSLDLGASGGNRSQSSGGTQICGKRRSDLAATSGNLEAWPLEAEIVIKKGPARGRTLNWKVFTSGISTRQSQCRRARHGSAMPATFAPARRTNFSRGAATQERRAARIVSRSGAASHLSGCGEGGGAPAHLFATGERSLRRHAGSVPKPAVRFAQPGTVWRPSSKALSLSGKFATVSAKAAASRLSAASQLNSSRIVSNAV